MVLELYVAGPGLEVNRRLVPGEPALILGRDTDCGICLPDPGRNVSRRHLSLWNDAGQLHFHVLSSVNGVETPAGELPPGARGILAPGEAMALSAYRLRVGSADDTQPFTAEPADPWAEFERQAAQLATDADAAAAAAPAEDDPFGDWGFHSTFGPGSPRGGLHADGLVPAEDLRSFFAGLGLDPTAQGGLTHGELETIGRLTRIALQGLLQAAQAAADSRQVVRADDRTRPATLDANPLRRDSPLEAKLYYLFGGQAAAGSGLAPDRAVAQLVTELAAHQQAMADALLDAVQGVVEEFDPEALKLRLLGGGARLFESARAWDAFARDYAERGAARPDWVRQLLQQHFARAYAQALMRAKRNTTGRPAP